MSYELNVHRKKQKSTEDESGIYLMDEKRVKPQFVSPAFLKRTFRTATDKHKVAIEAVLFNGCYSFIQAETVASVVPFVIGVSS